MGSVLTFAPREAAAIHKPPVAGATASIVIFPGIRYERRPEDTPCARKHETRHDAAKDKPKH